MAGEIAGGWQHWDVTLAPATEWLRLRPAKQFARLINFLAGNHAPDRPNDLEG